MSECTYRLQGAFERSPSFGENGPVSLQELMAASTQFALQNLENSLPRLHQSYGWDFLRRRHVRASLRMTNWKAGPVAPVFAPHGKRLNSLFPGFFEAERQTYAYRFLPQEPRLSPLTLDASDARLPASWQPDNSMDGWIEIVATEFPAEEAEVLARQLEDLLARMDRSAWLRLLEAWHAGQETFSLALSPHVEAIIPRTEAVMPLWGQRLVSLLEPCTPLEFRQRLTTARATSGWDERLEAWLLQTGSEKRRAQIGDRLVADAMVSEPDFLALRTAGLPVWFLERDFARPLQRLIDQARQFLFVGSFVIEDVEAAGWLARAARRMPGRVWVMCDLKASFQDHLDTLLRGQLNQTDRRFDLHRKKWESLRVLLDSPAQVRWVNGHLKTYMSEREALFGSANLTPRSLRGNLESYLQFEDAETLRALYHTLGTIWHHQAEARVYRPGTGTGLVLESIASQDRSDTFMRVPVGKAPFMDQIAYAVRVAKDLQQARESVHSLLYSMSENSILLQRGPRAIRRVVGIDARQVSAGLKRVRAVGACHAKIVVIDQRIVYLGGVNDPAPAGDMLDLMVRLESEAMGRELAHAVEEVVGLG